MKEYHEDEWMRLSLKPELTPEEESRVEAWLAEHPHQRAAWEEERALGRALQALPDAPVSNNFMARVWQEIDAEKSRAARAKRPAERHWLRVLLPRVGWATAALVLTVFVVQGNRVAQQKNQLARDVSLVGSELPSPEALRDFDAINGLRQVPAGSDDELLMALQ